MSKISEFRDRLWLVNNSLAVVMEYAERLPKGLAVELKKHLVENRELIDRLEANKMSNDLSDEAAIEFWKTSSENSWNPMNLWRVIVLAAAVSLGSFCL
jgi:hypothetical protein